MCLHFSLRILRKTDKYGENPLNKKKRRWEGWLNSSYPPVNPSNLHLFIQLIQKEKFLHKQQSLLSSRALPLDLLPPLYFPNPRQYFLFHTIYTKTPTFCIPWILARQKLAASVVNSLVYSGPNKTQNCWAHAAAFSTVNCLIYTSPQAVSTKPAGTQYP